MSRATQAKPAPETDDKDRTSNIRRRFVVLSRERPGRSLEGDAMFQLRPLAVGLIVLPRFASIPVRRKARAALCDQADIAGYALAEIFEVDGRPVKDDMALASLEALAGQINTVTVLTLGVLSRDVQRRLTKGAKLRIQRVPRPFQQEAG
jgi:hypothetical protein